MERQSLSTSECSEEAVEEAEEAEVEVVEEVVAGDQEKKHMMRPHLEKVSCLLTKLRFVSPDLSRA